MADWLEALEDRARSSLDPATFAYVSGGSGDGTTHAEAHAAWARHRFRPRVLRDVTQVDLTTTILGRPTRQPWGIAPTSLQGRVHPDGEVAMASAAAEADLPVVVSSNAGRSFGDVARTGARWWLQAYLPESRALAEPLLRAAVEAGVEAVVLTVDTPVVASKPSKAGDVWGDVLPDTVRVNFAPGYDDQPGSRKATDLCAADIGWLAERAGLPVVVKGVLRGDDAERCVAAGAAAVWVSNHGGRQLDRAVATAVALPEVVSAVGERCEVYVDGGLRTGLDVTVALALGADAVFFGRAPLYALVGGREGVLAWHGRLREEVLEALRLLGTTGVRDARNTSLLSPLPPL